MVLCFEGKDADFTDIADGDTNFRKTSGVEENPGGYLFDLQGFL